MVISWSSGYIFRYLLSYFLGIWIYSYIFSVNSWTSKYICIFVQTYFRIFAHHWTVWDCAGLPDRWPHVTCQVSCVTCHLITTLCSFNCYESRRKTEEDLHKYIACNGITQNTQHSMDIITYRLNRPRDRCSENRCQYVPRRKLFLQTLKSCCDWPLASAQFLLAISCCPVLVSHWEERSWDQQLAGAQLILAMSWCLVVVGHFLSLAIIWCPVVGGH